MIILFHFQLEMKSGAAQLFVSYKARNPNAAVNDFLLAVDSAGAGAVDIPYPPGTREEEEAEVFSSLLGDGLPEASNVFKLGFYNGTYSDGCAAQPKMVVVLLVVLAAVVTGV